MNRPVPMSQVCEQGTHHQCQGHDAIGGCRCPNPSHLVTPAEELRAAQDVLWDRAPNPDADLFTIEHQPRSWSVALGQLAWELERAGEDAPLLLRHRQGLEIARSVNGATGGAA